MMKLSSWRVHKTARPVEPIVVRPRDGGYELVVGERCYVLRSKQDLIILPPLSELR